MEHQHQQFSHDVSSLKDFPIDEFLLFRQHSQHLASTIKETIEGISKCFEIKKSSYLNQLKKLKEISNDAIRNAITGERQEAFHALSKLKASFEQQFETEKKALEEERKEFQKEKRFFDENYEKMKKEIEEMIEKDRSSLIRQQEAVKIALKEQKQEFSLEQKKIKENMIKDCQQNKDDFHDQVNMIKKAHEVREGSVLMR
jgi:glutamyl/glutaminyl-tRNA synthetase